MKNPVSSENLVFWARGEEAPRKLPWMRILPPGLRVIGSWSDCISSTAAAVPRRRPYRLRRTVKFKYDNVHQVKPCMKTCL